MTNIRRDIGLLLQKIRTFLLGREHTLAIRYQDSLAARNNTLPIIPDGPAHKLSSNYYYDRDARSDVFPARHIRHQHFLQTSNLRPDTNLPLPGNIYRWD